MPADSPLQSGQQVLHYRLVARLGAGGMGEVWRAADSTLGRDVALKSLPPAFAADPERLARFEREAKLLATLNHPNIATVFSVHEAEGQRYLAMEYVPGEDLAKRLARGAVPVRESLEIARQVALALEAAHEQGVVHRDLKPANVVVTPDERVKVLDFGLAKALETGGAAPTLMSQSPTFAGTMAGSGVILGTAGYMSPEQARGKPVDRRADIWAFGVVLYELLTGARAFEGETISDTLAAILRAEPDFSKLPSGLPAGVRAMLLRCLEKDPRRRLRDIGEALLVIEDALAGRDAAPAATAPAPPASRLARVAWPVALVVVAALAALGGALLRGTPPAPPLRKLTLRLDEHANEVSAITISPDGRHLAYLRGPELWVRDLDQTVSRRLAEGASLNFAPSWSPGSDRVLCVADGRLLSFDLASGAQTTLCSTSDISGGSGATWLGDSVIVCAFGRDHLYRVPASGGPPTVWLARVDTLEGDLHHPCALPDGRGMLFISHRLTAGPSVLCVQANGRRKDLLQLSEGGLWELAYDPRGWLLFGRTGEAAGVWAAPFSLAKLEITGDPRLILPEAGSPSISASGLLACRPSATAFRSQPVLVDRSGAVVDSLGPMMPGLFSIDLSPDGRRLAVEARLAGDIDAAVFDLDRRSLSRLAGGPGRQDYPVWSADGRSVIYRDDHARSFMRIVPVDASAPPRDIVRGILPRPTPDGAHLLYATIGQSDIGYASLDGHDSSLVVGGPASESSPAPHPHAGYMLYESNEGGARNVFLTTYPVAGARWQVSTSGGDHPFWSRRGDRAYYYTREQLCEVAVTLTPEVRLGRPQVLFDLDRVGVQGWGRYVVVPTADPDRFIALVTPREAGAGRPDAVLVENWIAEVTAKKP